MGYVLRVRLASFFTGAATASFLGLYILYKDYKVAHESIAQQVLSPHIFLFHIVWSSNIGTFFFSLVCAYVLIFFYSSLCLKVKSLHGPLDRRISALESLKHAETSLHVDATK
ncbi:hypothetical protein Gotur_013737 [Gossypium turneri]